MLARVGKSRRSDGTGGGKKQPESLIRIRTKGGKVFDVEDKVARMFLRIKSVIEEQESGSRVSCHSGTKGPVAGSILSHSLSLMTISSSSSSSSSCCADVLCPRPTILAAATTTGHPSCSSPHHNPSASPSNPTGLTCILGPEGEVLLDKTRGGIFALMIRWATHHRRDPAVQQFLRSDHPPLVDMPSYDQKFFAKLTRSQLFEMLQNSSYLQLPLLTEMLAKTIANQLKGKSIEDIRSEFGIASDYTPEEEQAIKEDTERFLRRLRGDCDTDNEDEDGGGLLGPHAALLNKCEAEMTESERLAFAQNIIPLLNSLQSFSS